MATVKTAKLLKHGDSQAVRLPKEFRFAGDEVLIKRVGNAVVLLPKTKACDSLIQSLEKFPSDFMSDREQPGEAERRDSLPAAQAAADLGVATAAEAASTPLR